MLLFYPGPVRFAEMAMNEPKPCIVFDLEEALEIYRKQTRTAPAEFKINAGVLSPVTYPKTLKASLALHFKSIRIENQLYESGEKV